MPLMNSPTRTILRIAALALSLALLVAADRGEPDALAGAIARAHAQASDTTPSGGLASDIRGGSLPVLDRARSDLAAGRRAAALHRLAAVSGNLAGLRHVLALGEAQLTEATLEREWKVSAAALDAPASYAQLTPALVRAEAEATRPQARAYHEGSLEYGRNTDPASGHFYLGAARGQLEFAEQCRAFAEPSTRRSPAIRSIKPELDALQHELMSAYLPPRSVERHGEFIGASSALKEARALDASGASYGALLRYLTALARSAPLLDTTRALADSAALAHAIDGFQQRLADPAVDHSIGQLFLELAQSEVAATPGGMPRLAVSIATRSLPGYFAAVGPAPVAAAARNADVTVTLVRWPFT